MTAHRSLQILEDKCSLPWLCIASQCQSVQASVPSFILLLDRAFWDERLVMTPNTVDELVGEHTRLRLVKVWTLPTSSNDWSLSIAHPCRLKCSKFCSPAVCSSPGPFSLHHHCKWNPELEAEAKADSCPWEWYHFPWKLHYESSLMVLRVLTIFWVLCDGGCRSLQHQHHMLPDSDTSTAFQICSAQLQMHAVWGNC